MSKQIHCSVCGQAVSDGEARYYFPTLAVTHSLAALSGIAHVKCLRQKDAELSIGQQLTDMRESMARTDASERFVRDGNVLIRGRLSDEGTVEVYDGEDFCDFSLSSEVAAGLSRGEIDNVKTPLLSIAIDKNSLSYASSRPSFSLTLEALPASRLRGLLNRFFEIQAI